MLTYEEKNQEVYRLLKKYPDIRDDNYISGTVDWDRIVVFLIEVVQRLEEEVDNEKYLNCNLRRICEERAAKAQKMPKAATFELLSEKNKTVKVQEYEGSCNSTTRRFYLVKVKSAIPIEEQEYGVQQAFMNAFSRFGELSNKTLQNISASYIDKSDDMIIFNVEYEKNYRTGCFDISFLCTQELYLFVEGKYIYE